MPTTLPTGHAWRRATRADAEAICELVTKYNTAVVGFGDYTLDDVRSDLAEPGFALDTDSWLVHAPGGTLVGYGWAIGKGTGEQVDVDVITTDRTVADWLFDQVLARAAELARAGGHTTVNVDKGVYRADEPMRTIAAGHGFAAGTVFHRMRIDHTAPPAQPVAPQGVILQSGPGDEQLRRTAHYVLGESFKDHYGYAVKTFDEWHAKLEARAAFDWSNLTLAELDGRPAGVLLTDDSFVEDEDCGYVADVGVLAEARGRGIAKYLLRTAFAADVRAGRRGTILHVDTNNTTPALGLYESVGMRAVLIIEAWRRQLTV